MSVNEIKSISEYRLNIRAAVRKLWNSYGDIYDFLDAMFKILDKGLEVAWQDGAIVCGVLVEERTDEEAQWLRAFIIEQRQHVYGFGVFIEDNSKANGGALDTVFSRAELWVRAYDEVKTVATQKSCQNSKMMWQWDGGEHCQSCRRLNGRVARNSTWAKHGLYPRCEKLQCFVGCKCSLVPTTQRITPGRFPSL